MMCVETSKVIKYDVSILSHVTPLWGVLPSAKRPEGRAARGRPGNVWQYRYNVCNVPVGLVARGVNV